jgi:hypothetical protein
MELCSMCSNLVVKDVSAEDDGRLVPEFECVHNLGRDLDQGDVKACSFFQCELEKSEYTPACGPCGRYHKCLG